jgi:LuxR family maltose regulon positive regulatory protein
VKISSRILRPKLQPPRLGPDRLERPRLLTQLDQGLSRQFTLLAAPAGYGKTTLLSQWIARQELPTVWLTLDEGDNELSLFLEELVVAVRTFFPDACGDFLPLLSRPTLPPVELLSRELVNDLDDLDQFILVLDDCHNLKDSQILTILRNLVCQPPGSLHLVLSCRADPLLPLGALRGRGLLNEVREADLRFDKEEAHRYLEHAFGRPLTKTQVEPLIERTEGWIAGLHLAALTFRSGGISEEGLREFAGSDRYVADYLMEELWSRLDPAVRRYLLATSILDRLCAPLCQAVMGEETIDSIEGRPVLEWLEDAGLFVVSLDQQREWFRYHHLFQDLLRHRLRTTWPRADVDALHVRAGQWLGAHDFVEDAVGHLLKAGMPDLAAGVVEVHRRDAIERERWQALRRWLGKLGPDLVDVRPALVLAHAWLAHQRGDFPDMCRHADHAEHLLDQVAQPPGDEALRGEIAVIRAHTSYWEAEGDRALSYAREGQARLPQDYRFGRATATVFEGGALHLLGRNEEAFQVLGRGSFGEYGTGVHLRVMSGLAMLAFATGEVDYADHVANLMLSRAVDRGLQESAGWAHYFLGLSACLRNHLSKAEYHFAAVDPYASYFVPAKQSFYGLAWVRQAQGRSDEALEIMDQFTSVVSDLNLPLRSEVRLLRARLSALSGRPTAEAVLARSLLPAAGDGPLQLKMCHELSALSAIALLLLEGSDNDLSACQAGLRRLRATAEATGSVFRSVQGLILQALLFDRQDLNPEALASLAQAVELAKPGHLMRLFPEMGNRVSALLQALRVRGNGDVFLDELIAGFVGEELQSRATPPSRPSVPGQEDLIDTLLTKRELDVLELLERRLSNKEIAKQLVISPSTVKRHTLSIYSKLGVGSRQGAVAKARRLGLLPAPR